MKIAAVVRELIAAGVVGEALVAAIARIEASGGFDGQREPLSAAERSRRYRERKRHEKSDDAEGDRHERHVTRDASLSQSEELIFSSTTEENQTLTLPPVAPLPGIVTAAGELFELVASGPPTTFEVFWAAYPAKVGKGAARKSWDRAVKGIGGLDPGAAILVALERQKASPRWNDPTYQLPNPATWLNQERWADEPDQRCRPMPMTGGMVAAASDEAALRLAREMMRERAGRTDGRGAGALAALPAPAADGEGRGALVN